MGDSPSVIPGSTVRGRRNGCDFNRDFLRARHAVERTYERSHVLNPYRRRTGNGGRIITQ